MNIQNLYLVFKKKGCSKVFSIIGERYEFKCDPTQSIQKNVIYFHNEQSLSLAQTVTAEPK